MAALIVYVGKAPGTESTTRSIDRIGRMSVITSPSGPRAQLATATTEQSTAALATALEILCADGPLDEAERLVRNVIVETLYDRHPEVAAAYDAWIDDLESEEPAEAVVINAARGVL